MLSHFLEQNICKLEYKKRSWLIASFTASMLIHTPEHATRTCLHSVYVCMAVYIRARVAIYTQKYIVMNIRHDSRRVLPNLLLLLIESHRQRRYQHTHTHITTVSKYNSILTNLFYYNFIEIDICISSIFL